MSMAAFGLAANGPTSHSDSRATLEREKRMVFNFINPWDHDVIRGRQFAQIPSDSMAVPRMIVAESCK